MGKNKKDQIVFIYKILYKFLWRNDKCCRQMLSTSLYWWFKTFRFRNTIFDDCTCDCEWNNSINRFILFDAICCRYITGRFINYHLFILFLNIVYIIARKICKEREFEQIERMRDTVAVDQRIRVRISRRFPRFSTICAPATILKVTLLGGCFSCFLNCAKRHI